MQPIPVLKTYLLENGNRLCNVYLYTYIKLATCLLLIADAS